MKPIKDEEVTSLMQENLDTYGEYEKVTFIANVNGKPTELSGVRLIDSRENEYFIVRTKNQGYYNFSAPEVSHFERVSVEKREEEDESLNPLSPLQKAIADKIQQEKAETAEHSKQMAEKLADSIGYFPLLQSANVSGLTVDFLDKNQEVQDSIYFPFVKGETYEVFSHEDERDIEINSLMVDVSLATDENGDDVKPELFAKYYETYNVIQDFEFIIDDNYTQEIFNTYRLNEKYARVVGDLNKHDLLELVTENSQDKNIQEAAKELRIKSGLLKKDPVKFKP
jgi:hypothetical protein